MDQSDPGTAVPDAHAALAARLEADFRAWEDDPRRWPDPWFEERALEVFELQFAANRPYSRYCRSIGRTPADVTAWTEIPPVPTAAFRAVELIVGDPADASLRFRTSGTTGGSASRGVHLVRRPETYRAAVSGPFRHFVLGGAEACRMLAIHPPFEPARDSSLGWMVDEVYEAFGGPASLRVEAGEAAAGDDVARSLEIAASEREPVVILGTTLALADWLDRLLDRDLRVDLPDGSRIMDTGGVKGRTGVDRDAVMAGLIARLGLPESAAVNEFGMTELLSQRYGSGLGRVELRGPPWLRTRALDPVSLEDRPEGEEGILCHYDLANVGSVLAVLTEDRGRVTGDAVEWLGRTPGAMPRGCSLATAEFLEAQR